jgi:CBS domain-containing protein
MSTVGQLLQAKGAAVWSVSPDSSVYEALEMMAHKDVGAVLVLEAGKLVGIFSERDYARKVILKGKSSRSATVSEMMTRRVLFTDPEATIDACMMLMTEKRVRHLPVLENDKPIGIVSIGDVVKRIISEQKFTIQELEKYITGSGYGG